MSHLGAGALPRLETDEGGGDCHLGHVCSPTFVAFALVVPLAETGGGRQLINRGSRRAGASIDGEVSLLPPRGQDASLEISGARGGAPASARSPDN
jgi:hypothetical protein